jgi:hypothetical protein
MANGDGIEKIRSKTLQVRGFRSCIVIGITAVVSSFVC